MFQQTPDKSFSFCHISIKFTIVRNYITTFHFLSNTQNCLHYDLRILRTMSNIGLKGGEEFSRFLVQSKILWL